MRGNGELECIAPYTHSPALPSDLTWISLDETIEILSYAFLTDPLNRYLVLDHFRLPESTSIGVELNRKWFRHFLQPIADDGGLFLGTADHAVVSVWQKTTVEREIKASMDYTGGIADFFNATAPCLRAEVRDEYWHHVIVGRHPHLPRRTGLNCGSVMRYINSVAYGTRVPLWAEITNALSRDIHIHYGWRVVESVRVGAAVVNHEGRGEAGGAGVKIWIMIK